MPATPDPELALRLAKETVEVYSEAADRMVATVARRLARGISEPGWAERKLIEVANLRNDALRVLQDLQQDGPATVRQAIESAYAQGAAQGAADLKALGDTVVLDQQFIRTHARAIDALVRETVTKIESTHLQILRNTVDGYRRVVSEVSAPGVLSGTETRRQATQRALNRWAKEGVKGFVDSAGRGWELETYAEMATRTAVGRAQTAGTLDRFAEAGRDLVIVSDAPQECKVCRPWEGKVLSLGSTPTGTQLSGGFVVAGTVSEATSAGLHHANCRHTLGAYIDGLTQRFKNTEDPEGDRLRQEQRRLERNVRKWKRVVGAQLPEHHEVRQMQKSAEDLLRQAQARLKSHVDTNDLKRLRHREQIGRAR